MALPIMEPAMEPTIEDPMVPMRDGPCAAGWAAMGGGAARNSSKIHEGLVCNAGCVQHEHTH